MSEATEERSNQNRPRLTSVAIPSEHGGWSLTLEPVLLGLFVQPSVAGVGLGLLALLAFLLRTPLKTALVDRRRGRRLPRTVVAERLVVVESAIGLGLIGLVAFTADGRFWWPLLAAAPLVLISIWYDIRSRSRHLIPELAGTIGVAAVAAAIVLAGGGLMSVAVGMWLVAAARAVAAVLFVRVQLRRAKHQPTTAAASDSAQAVAVAGTSIGAGFGVVPWLGVGAIVVLAGAHIWLVRRPPPRAAVIGAQQVVLGLTVILVTGLAVLAP